MWTKALNRRNNDPEGAITAARTLIETVCKHILDDAGIPYGPTDDLPNLWHRTATVLNLAPSQHQVEKLPKFLIRPSSRRTDTRGADKILLKSEYSGRCFSQVGPSLGLSQQAELGCDSRER